MAYGILKSSVVTNTGSDSELLCKFVAPISIISNQPSYVQENMNLSVSASRQGAQRWEITTNLEPTTDSASLMVHQLLNGHNAPFYIRMPQISGLLDANKKLIENAINAKTRAQTVANSSAVSVVPGTAFTAGEFIQFEGSNKVYLVTVSSSSDSVDIEPPLRGPVGSNITILRGKNVTMKARYNSDVQLGIIYIDGILADNGSIKLIEAV